MSKTIPFFTLSRQPKKLEGDIRKAIERVLKSGRFIGGEEVEAFEQEFCDWLGAKYGVSVACGFDAIKLSLMALGIGKGDEVITSAHGCPATPMAIKAAGATPVFVDCNEHDVIEPSAIEGVLTKRTKAIVPVHLYGMPCNMTAIMRIARKYKLKVVEDCAQAHGAMWNAKKIGLFGDVACFSFYPTKNLGALGDAGIAVTASKNIAEKIRQLANYGEISRFKSAFFGVNSRMDTLQAAILREKLKYLDQFIARRREIAQKYHPRLRGLDIKIPTDPPKGIHVFHLYVVHLKNRDAVMKKLQKAGVGCDVHYPIPLHLLGAFNEGRYKKGDFPNAEESAQSALSLPMYPELNDSEVDYVVEALARAICGNAPRARD